MGINGRWSYWIPSKKAGRFQNDVCMAQAQVCFSNQIGPLSSRELPQYSATFGISRSSCETGSAYKYLAHGMTNQIDNIQTEAYKLNHLNAKLYIN